MLHVFLFFVGKATFSAFPFGGTNPKVTKSATHPHPHCTPTVICSVMCSVAVLRRSVMTLTWSVSLGGTSYLPTFTS